MAEKQESFWTDKNNYVGYCLGSVKSFAIDSKRLIKKCSKPDRKEYKKIVVACAIGFAIMGFIGYFVKLLFIPINNILIGT